MVASSAGRENIGQWLVGNHGAGKITIVDLEAAAPLREFEAGVGVETLAYY